MNPLASFGAHRGEQKMSSGREFPHNFDKYLEEDPIEGWRNICSREGGVRDIYKRPRAKGPREKFSIAETVTELLIILRDKP